MEREAVAEAKRRADRILESMPASFFAVDREWRLTYANHEAERFTARKREDVLGRSLWEEFPELAGTPFEVQLRRAMAEQVPVRFEYFCGPQNAWAEVHAYPSDGGLAVYYQDITERKRMQDEREKERAEAEQRAAELDSVISSAADGVLIYDAQGRIRRANAEAERMLGYRPTEREQLLQGWMGTRVETVDGRPFPPEEAPLVRAQRGERVRGIPAVIRRPLHAPVWVTLSAAPLRTPGGEDLGVVVTAADVTALHELQEDTVRLLEAARQAKFEAEEAQARLEAVLQQLPSGVAIAEAPSGRLVLGNEQMARTLRRPFQPLPSVAQYSGYVGYHPDNRPYRPEEWPLARSIRTGEVVHGEVVDLQWGDGSRATISINSAPIRDRNGHIVAAVAVFDDVSERKRLQDERERLLADLQAANERLRVAGARLDEAAREAKRRTAELEGMLNSSPDLLFVMAADGTILEYHKGVTTEIYVPPERFLGRQLRDVLPPEVAVPHEEGIRRALEERTAVTFEYPLRVAGRDREYEARITALDGDRALVIARDITERKRAEEALRESEERWRRVFEEGPLGMALAGLDFRLVAVNARAARALGHTPAEMAGRSFAEITRPDDAAKDVELSRRLAAGEIGRYSLEKRYVTRQGNPLWARLNVSMIRDAGGRPQYYLAMIEDISERKRAEEELRESEERWRRVFEEGPLGMAITGLDARFVKVNARMAGLLGYSEQEMVGLSIAGITYPDDVGVGQELSQRLYRGEIPRFTLEKRYVRRDGGIVWGNLTASAIHDERGRPVNGLAMIQDITERKRMEAERERLRDDAERRAAELDSTVSSIADGLIIYDAEGRIVRMNAEAERQTGYGPAGRALSLEEMAGPLHTADGRPLRPEETPSLRALQGETVRGVTLSIRRPGREPLWVRSTAAPIREPDGEIVGAVVTSTDVSELRRLEEQTARLLEAERHARERAEAAVRARDEFLAASAHELKTPITNLRGYAQITMRRLEREQTPDPVRTRQALEVIDRQSDRLARLVQQLLDVASVEAGHLELHRQETDFVPLVRDVVEDIQAGTKRHPIVLEAPPSIRALVDPARIEQVVANLLDNAVKFSPQGAPVEVELATPQPGTLQLCVRDYGPGIPPDRRPQLFSRFYQAQTGRPFAGLGLGLYYSRRIAELHGGEIRAEFPPEGGSRFVVTLPAEGTDGAEGREGTEGAEGAGD